MGIAGTGSAVGVDEAEEIAGLEEKKSLVAGSDMISEKGVIGVSGERSVDDALSALRKPLSILAKSLSEEIEAAEELEMVDSAEIFRISGAFKASTFVVLISSVGREILARLIVPGV